METPHVVAIAVALAGCVTDTRSRRIPNLLTFGAAAAAFGFGTVTGGLSGLGWSVAGWLAGVALFAPFFALGGIGGGDVKLLAALGAWLGPGMTVWLALWSAVAGGPMALALAFARGYSKEALGNLWGLVGYWRVMGVRPHPGLTLESAPAHAPRLPYSWPIAVGLMVTLWLR